MKLHSKGSGMPACLKALASQRRERSGLRLQLACIQDLAWYNVVLQDLRHICLFGSSCADHLWVLSAQAINAYTVGSCGVTVLSDTLRPCAGQE